MAAKLERPVLAVDVVLLRAARGELEVLLSRRAEEPFKGKLALPGVAVQVDETLEQAALRALAQKAGLLAAPGSMRLEQLATFDALYRDPRGRTVSVAFLALARAGMEEPARGHWRSPAAHGRGSLPFDHDAIVETALGRLAGKLRYTNIAAKLLPPVFPIEEIQALYEALLGRHLNRANFRTKLLKIDLIERAGSEPTPGSRGGRPRHLYRFRRERPEVVERDFL